MQHVAAQPAELRLILAAIELFGRDGFAAVTTRELAQHAETNVSSIKYHFGGKDELYREAVSHVINTLTPNLKFVISHFDASRELVGQDRTLQARLIKGLVERLLQFFLGSEEIPHFMPFVMREFFMPGPHFRDFYESLPKHLHELFTQLVAMVDDADPHAETTIVRAHAVLGQIMIFHIGRPVLFARIDAWEDTFTAERIELITAEVQRLVLNSLGLADPDLEEVNSP